MTAYTPATDPQPGALVWVRVACLPRADDACPGYPSMWAAAEVLERKSELVEVRLLASDGTGVWLSLDRVYAREL